MSDSPRFQLTSVDYEKIKKDLVVFFSIPLIVYITSVLALIQAPHHILDWKDFIPSNTTMIIFVGYLGNQTINVLRKYIA